MKKHARALALLLTIALLLPITVSCGTEDIPARERLSDLLCLFEDTPAGGVYATLPLEGDQALEGRLIGALYTRADGHLEYDGRVAEAAVYLGSAQDPFFEAAVFVCYGNSDVRAISEMCMRRARLVASAHVVEEEDTVLAVSGRTVVYIITRDKAAAQRVIDKLL